MVAWRFVWSFALLSLYYGPYLTALLLVGSDTTMATLENFFLVMTLHPEVQKKAQKELDDIVGNDRLPTFNDGPYLPYIDCIIKEIWRWNTAVPFAAHSLSKDDEYRGYFIPANTVVMVNNWSVFRSPELVKARG
ncbi:hypothetical protein PTI98_012473 [Pleurotus ostreatus]|nr:hypothetical protein PTI98_012473 [Pleurotus ostreatus]